MMQERRRWSSSGDSIIGEALCPCSVPWCLWHKLAICIGAPIKHHNKTLMVWLYIRLEQISFWCCCTSIQECKCAPVKLIAGKEYRCGHICFLAGSSKKHIWAGENRQQSVYVPIPELTLESLLVRRGPQDRENPQSNKGIEWET